MKKTSASILFGILLDIIFSLFFIFLLSQWSTNDENITLHMNQVGIFKEIENSENCIQKLKDNGLIGYQYSKDDLYIVVTSLYENKQECLDEQSILKEHSFSYVLKEVHSKDHNFIEAVKSKNFMKIMELMSN